MLIDKTVECTVATTNSYRLGYRNVLRQQYCIVWSFVWLVDAKEASVCRSVSLNTPLVLLNSCFWPGMMYCDRVVWAPMFEMFKIDPEVGTMAVHNLVDREWVGAVECRP